jgi:hypothetical protein
MPEKVQVPSSYTMNPTTLKKVAESELHESPKTRKRTLRELRDWLKNQPHISGARTDNSFLLRFLRLKKFDMADTIKVLDKYLRMRTQNPGWFANLDIREAKLNQLISDGYCFVLPQRDSKGRRVIYSKASAMDASLFTASDVMRAHLLTFEALLEDEDVQVNGLTYIFDERDVNWSHISVWTPSEVSKAFSCCERALPLRHREIHFVHLPWTMSLVFQFAKSLLSQKLRDRFTTHANFDKLAEHVPASILPAEAGGTVPMSEMIDQWKAVLEERRALILNSDLVEYGLENIQVNQSEQNKKTSTSVSSEKNNSNSATSNSNNSSEVIEVMSSVCKLDMSS